MIQNLTNLRTFHKPFHFLTPKERDLHCSHDVMLRTKQTHTYTYYQFIQHQYNLNTPARQSHHDINTLTLHTPHHFFLTSPIVLKTLTYKAPSEITITSPRCISSVP